MCFLRPYLSQIKQGSALRCVSKCAQAPA
uniref:Uncharacterized protein n=1 Tax=Anopheles quadriannulatus TaxID=34691 RepID=A0A182XTX3_ANOQN